MLVREYQISDCKEITKLFYNTPLYNFINNILVYEPFVL